MLLLDVRIPLFMHVVQNHRTHVALVLSNRKQICGRLVTELLSFGLLQLALIKGESSDLLQLALIKRLCHGSYPRRALGNGYDFLN